jgi:tetratricopeptide (TPR) repeat protein
MRRIPWRRLAPTGLLLLVATTGCVKRPIDYQRDLAHSLRPSELLADPEPGEPRPAATRVWKVRAWVDEDFQALTPRWHERVAEQLRRANLVVEPRFGVRFELVDARPWPRTDRAPQLEAALRALAATDPGRDAELVLGYVSAVRVPTASTESLGMAELGGHHLVLRAMVLQQEYDVLGKALDLLPADEREELARARRLHREVTILLHEWAHTLGAPHESLSASIMADVYHSQAAGFSPESARIIEAALRGEGPSMGASAPAPAPARPSTRSPLESDPSVGVAASLPANLRPGLLPSAQRPAGSAPPAPAPAPRGRGDGQAMQLASLTTREAGLSAASAPHADWLALARDADRLGAPALAERAALRAGMEPGAEIMLSDARRARREVALPLDGSIPPAREPEYGRAVAGVLEAVSAGKVPAAREALRPLAAAFPGSPGLALATCAVRFAEKGQDAAAACEAAARAYPEAPRAHLLLGRAQARAGRWLEARDQFREALTLDAAVGEPWSRLAGALRELGEAEPLRDLERRYQARFGGALRPARD